ncbi:MAG: hypothetical protein O9273_08880 [Acetobacteraceae bacterium]|jgi:hypothetical protein|nr:hypothetical protein [Acetobacteraceae bacterium]
MARNASTFAAGNGKGYGGPARGPGMGFGVGGPARGMRAPFGPENRPSPEAQSAGKAVATETRARIAAHAAEIVQAQLDRALDLAHPQGHAAAKALLDMICPPETRQSLSGAPDAMMAFTIVTGVPRAGD